jgi:hypothetical protein
MSLRSLTILTSGIKFPPLNPESFRERGDQAVLLHEVSDKPKTTAASIAFDALSSLYQEFTLRD